MTASTRDTRIPIRPSAPWPISLRRTHSMRHNSAPKVARPATRLRAFRTTHRSMRPAPDSASAVLFPRRDAKGDFAEFLAVPAFGPARPQREECETYARGTGQVLSSRPAQRFLSFGVNGQHRPKRQSLRAHRRLYSIWPVLYGRYSIWWL